MTTMRRAVVGSFAALALVAALVAVMVPFRGHMSATTAALVLVVPIVTGVVVGGPAAGTVSIVAALLAYDFFFIRPYYSLSVGAGQNWVVLAVYAVVMSLVAIVVARLDSARTEARRREDAVRRLFELSDVLIEDRPLPEVLDLIVSTAHQAFGGCTASLLLPSDDGLEVVASAGQPLSEAELRRVTPVPGVPARLGTAPGHHGSQTVALSAAGRPVGLLDIREATFSRHDRDLLHTFANHVALTLERSQLREQALRSELLEKVDRLQRSLVGAVSHDLRTPLATIKISASTLRDADLVVGSAQRDELLSLIDEQTDRLDRLVTNLLDVSRVQAGVLELHNEPIAVIDLVSDAVRGLGHVTQDADIEMAVAGDLPLVDVDHLLIGQVLTNLLDNAVRHAPAGTPVTVSASLAQSRVQLSVEDHGPGIPRSRHADAFRMFSRGGAVGGTGLGLSIARAFVQAHGEELWVEEAPGGGARLCFTVPVAPTMVAVR